MGLIRELQKHHVHWFVLIALLLYVIAVDSGVRPVHPDELPHAEAAPGTELRGF
tara:strand:+ start:328 stop:489 length:162 start_codon:yes stop_codon:yes gene_type:complete